MRMLATFLLIAWLTPCALSQQSSPQPAPLNEPELRTILDQLYELKAARARIVALEAAAERDREQDERERANATRALELEREATALARRELDVAVKERDLAADKAAFYESAFRSLTKKPGLGCRILASLSLGIHRCN